MNRVLASSVVASVCPSLTLRPTRTPSIGERIVVRSRSISADLEQRLLLRQRRDGGVELRLDALDVRPGALDLVFLRDGDRLRLAQRGFGRAELGLRVLDVDAGADRALAQRLLAPELALLADSNLTRALSLRARRTGTWASASSASMRARSSRAFAAAIVTCAISIAARRRRAAVRPSVDCPPS
jgi:hypothetical protein